MAPQTSVGHWSARPAREGIGDQVRVFLPHADSVVKADLEQSGATAQLRWHLAEANSDITLIVDATTGTPHELRQVSSETGSVRIITYTLWNTAADIVPPE